MLNFAEQTGSGAVMLVWSFPQRQGICSQVNEIEVGQHNQSETKKKVEGVRRWVLRWKESKTIAMKVYVHTGLL